MTTPLVAPGVLAELDAGLLGRLLAPYPAFLEGRRLALGDDTPAWRARLVGVLNGGDRAMPVGLQHAFWAIGSLASPVGEAVLRALAAERGRTVPVAPGRTADVAAGAFLDERALFRDARARVCASVVAEGAPSGESARHQGQAGDEESGDEVDRRR
jgi:hypothetical protein